MNEHDFFKTLKTLSIRKEDKIFLKARLLDYAKQNPVSSAKDPRLAKGRPLILRPMPIFLALVLLVSGSTAYAAESTLPGDTLYPIKVEVSENVKGWFKFGSVSKAEWNAELAERRLAEAETLAASGKLDEEIVANIEARLNKHTERAQAKIVSLQEQGRMDAAARINSRLESSLEVHEQILSNLEQRLEDANFEPLLSRMRLRLENASDTRVEINSRVELDTNQGKQTAAQRLSEVVKSHLDRIKNLMESKRAELDAEVIVQIDEKIILAEAKYTEGQELLTDGEFDSAFEVFLQANRLLVHLNALINANVNLPVRIHLDSRENIHGDIREKIRLRLDSDDTTSTTNTIKTEDIKTETHLEINNNSGGNQIRSRLNIDIE